LLSVSLIVAMRLVIFILLCITLGGCSFLRQHSSELVSTHFWDIADKTLPVLNQQGNDIISDTNIFICEVPIEATTDMEQWRAYLEKNLELDEQVLDTIPAGRYTAIIQFEIDKEGKVTHAQITTDPGYGLGKKAIDAVLHYTGTWQPAWMRGSAIKAYRSQSITFVIEEDDVVPPCHYTPSNPAENL
jgi:hypothetical protein